MYFMSDKIYFKVLMKSAQNAMVKIHLVEKFSTKTRFNFQNRSNFGPTSCLIKIRNEGSWY